MGTYGRNFDFRIVPDEDDRQGRFFLNQVDVPIGVPVVASGAVSSALTDAQPVVLATSAQAPPRPGRGGIVVYEWIDLYGTDPLYNTYSDRDLVPQGKLCQVIAGPGLKVVFTNTVARSFLHQRNYPGRVMVAGATIATPTVVAGDLLSPGVGDDTNGYWVETQTPGEAWLVVTNVSASRREIEAEILF